MSLLILPATTPFLLGMEIAEIIDIICNSWTSHAYFPLERAWSPPHQPEVQMKDVSPVFLIFVAILFIVFHALYMRTANNPIEAEAAAFEGEVGVQLLSDY
jgi:preprotein translocase subunit SecY